MIRVIVQRSASQKRVYYRQRQKCSAGRLDNHSDVSKLPGATYITEAAEAS